VGPATGGAVGVGRGVAVGKRTCVGVGRSNGGAVRVGVGLRVEVGVGAGGVGGGRVGVGDGFGVGVAAGGTTAAGDELGISGVTPGAGVSGFWPPLKSTPTTTATTATAAAMPPAMAGTGSRPLPLGSPRTWR
jgi:hypothetical protein